MPSLQIRSILDSFRNFYGELAECFQSQVVSSTGQQLPYLCQYIAEHEREIQKAIDNFENETADEALLDTWLQFGADETLRRILDELELRAGMTEDDVIGEALKADAKIIALYRELAGESGVPDVRELFEGFANMQNARTRQLARAIG